MSVAEKLQTIAENEQRVYEAGFEAGKQSGGDNWYDTFWDSFQENGSRRKYTDAFAYWPTEAFKPKYDLIVQSGRNYTMFNNAKIEGSLTEILNDTGIVLIFNGGYSSSTFSNSIFTEIDISSSNPFSTWSSTFSGCKNLKTLKLPQLYSGASFPNTFSGCTELEDVTLTGTIGNSISFQNSSKLTDKSTQSIFDCLATVETAQTLTLHNELKILQSQVDSANAKGWTVAGGTVVSEEEYYA